MQKMQSKDAIEILRKHGTEITEQQAKEILEFLRVLSNIAVQQYLTKQETVNLPSMGAGSLE